jgi:hypothetical protein
MSILFSSGAPIKMSASVRPGKIADSASGTQRVKRRVTTKYAFPTDSTGPLGNAVVDFINIDCTISLPVDSTEAQIRTAVNTVNESFFSSGSCLRDMLVDGNEPY